MELDLMVGPMTWSDTAALAERAETAGVGGMLFTETTQTPWMSIAAAAAATDRLTFTTGIAVAFPRSPMVTAATAWEIAENSQGRFRLGLGSQVRAHIERRYGSDFDHPGPRMRDYLGAVRASFAAFGGDEPLAYESEFYQLSFLPRAWAPRRHDYGDIKIDVSAVGPWMTRMAGEVADGVHVHPLHSIHYLETRLLPRLALGAADADRSLSDVDLIIPVFAVPGDTPEERAPLLDVVRTQIGFYGSTRNYAFQFDDLGFDGLSAELHGALKVGDFTRLMSLVTDDVLEHFAVIASWDELADRLVARYGDTATRLVMYLAQPSIEQDPHNLDRWGEIARAVETASR